VRLEENLRKNTFANDIPQRRRAQNRASQRAFRDRKEKRMKEMDETLTELQGQHSELTRSYESLQAEYAAVKQELDDLRRRHHEEGSMSRSMSVVERGLGGEWEDGSSGDGQEVVADPLLFDVAAFCFGDPVEG
jgi:predicted RNase H-like nuclease (RuvC/YqgF family)